MHIPGLGTLIEDESLGWYISDEVTIKALGAQPYRICLEGYDDDDDKEAFHEAIANLLSIDEDVL
ncbi:MAG TPA: hypothetical protein VIM98_09040 [Dyella sp.]